jgi:isoprenylcysteine carboxyl methyltransferase (ICMT) family protein YpbQ
VLGLNESKECGVTMSPVLAAFFAVAVLLRFASLFVSKRNEARLRARGAEEFGARNTRLLSVLHITFYGAAFLEGLWRGSQFDAWTWVGLTIYGVAMLVLVYVIHDLGALWSVKVFIAPGHTLKQSWLFRTVRHPNYYLNVLPELVGVALVMKAWLVFAILFPCYAAVLFRRIKIEEEVMRKRFPLYR